MAEESVVEPLSSEEIIDAMCFKLRNALENDCYLAPGACYEALSGTLSIRLQLADCGRAPEVKADRKIALGKRIVEDNEDAALIEMDISLEPKAPNAVRMETQQPLPVAVDTPDGRREIKRIKYANSKTVAKQTTVQSKLQELAPPVLIPEVPVVELPPPVEMDPGEDMQTAQETGDEDTL